MRQIFLSHKFLRPASTCLFICFSFPFLVFSIVVAALRKEEKNSSPDLHKEPYQATSEQQKKLFHKTLVVAICLLFPTPWMFLEFALHRAMSWFGAFFRGVCVRSGLENFLFPWNVKNLVSFPKDGWEKVSWAHYTVVALRSWPDTRLTRSNYCNWKPPTRRNSRLQLQTFRVILKSHSRFYTASTVFSLQSLPDSLSFFIIFLIYFLLVASPSNPTTFLYNPIRKRHIRQICAFVERRTLWIQNCAVSARFREIGHHPQCFPIGESIQGRLPWQCWSRCWWKRICFFVTVSLYQLYYADVRRCKDLSLRGSKKVVVLMRSLNWFSFRWLKES